MRVSSEEIRPATLSVLEDGERWQVRRSTHERTRPEIERSHGCIRNTFLGCLGPEPRPGGRLGPLGQEVR